MFRRQTPQEFAFNLLVRVWTRALLERFRVPPPRIRVGVIDVVCVAVITATSGLGEVPAMVLSEVYDFVRRPAQQLTREQQDSLRLLARGWIEMLRDHWIPCGDGAFRWGDVDLRTGLPIGCDTPMMIPGIRVPAEILAASFGVIPADLLKVLASQQTQLYGAVISFGPRRVRNSPANDVAA